MHRFAWMVGAGYLVLGALVTILTLTVGPLGSAPFPLPIGVSREPISITVWYSTEKRQWLEAAVNSFQAQNPTINGRPIQVTLVGMSSGEIAQRVVSQDWRNAPPTVVSPASSRWITSMNRDWSNSHSAALFATGSDAPQPLVLSPLVLISWQDRSSFLWPNSNADLWHPLHDALTNADGWKALGGNSAWGKIKFAHTSPLSSNSGEQTLTLISYSYFNKTSGLTTQDLADPSFQSWLRDFKSRTTISDKSSGQFLTQVLQFGPSTYDVVALYENLAIEGLQKRSNYGTFQVYYPSATLLSDHPYALLQNSGSSTTQQAAAARFREFLLSATIQQTALESGFRPADVNVAINGSNSPFTIYQQNGLRQDILQQAEEPAPEVLNALQSLWQQLQ